MRSTDFLDSKDAKYKTIRLSEVPRTAEDVSRIYGCDLHSVVKSVVLVGKSASVLVVLPGDCRIDVKKLATIAGKDSYKMASPEEVKNITGYPVGGVTPFGDMENVVKIVDESVFEMDSVNIGSGIAEIGINIGTDELRRIWDGEIADVIEVQ